jgi:hypothetical protein
LSPLAKPFRQSPRRSRLFGLLYLLAVLCFVEIVLQGYYRLTTGVFLYSRDKPPIWAADGFSGLTNRPGMFYQHVTPEFSVALHTNSQGFRVSPLHTDYLPNKPPNTFRILLLGPSFAFGWGSNFEDTFGVRLQEQLARDRYAGGKNIEVLNHGVPALSAQRQLEWFRHAGKNYVPDLVIHLVYGSLELEAPSDHVITVENDRLVSSTMTFKDRLWRSAKCSAMIFYTGIVLSQLPNPMQADKRESFIEGAGRRMRNAQAFEVRSRGIDDSLKFYAAFDRAAREAGANFLIVYVPLAYVIYPEDRTRWVLHGVKDVEAQMAFNDEFSRYLNGVHIPCMNLTNALLESARRDSNRLYYWLDVHWTPLGNRRSAEAVAKYLMSGGAGLT